ncbi:unnamed protein product [Prunus armeniaca]
MLACWDEDPNGESYKKHLARIADYIWLAEDGIKIQSFGSQMWDASFTIQALLAANLNDELGFALKKGQDYLKKSQVRDNPSGDFLAHFRHISKGAWTFSNQDHGCQVSDCTAESLKGLPSGPSAYRFVKHFALLRAKENLQRQNPLGLATAVLKAEAEGRKRHGSDHQSPDQGIKCVPMAKGVEHKIRAVAEIYGGHTTMLLNPKPPCFTIPNADLTTHLPRSGSTTQTVLARPRTTAPHPKEGRHLLTHIPSARSTRPRDSRQTNTCYVAQCCLLLSMLPPQLVGEQLEPERLYDAVNVILSLQSPNGGVSAWDPTGAPKWVEWLNPVEFLENLTIEYEYGNWGICFIYGTWFAIRGLEAAGKTYNNCEAIRRGVEFLLKTQRDDGGWGESYISCTNKSKLKLISGIGYTNLYTS